MSPRTMNGNPRLTARIVLVAVAILLAVFVLFSTGPIGGLDIVFAQTASPSATPCQGITIEWVNPDSGLSSEVSAEDKDGEPTGTGTYHLVAWVSQAPSNATVEFKYTTAAGDQTITNNATRVGTDTFEHFWSQTALPDEENGSLATTLKAQLFVSGILCDDDQQAVTINDDPDPGPPTGETPPGPSAESIEITDPTNGAQWGLYRNPNSAEYSGLVDTKSSEARGAPADPTSSPGTTFVRIFYSISAPGTDPVWKECATDETADAADGSRCVLIDDDTPDEVNLVGAVANDSEDPLGADSPGFDQANDSSDGHRVLPYQQDARTVNLVFEDGSGNNAGSPSANQSSGNVEERCTPFLVATILDQLGKPIANANVDAKAQGPSDALNFASSSGTSAFRSPDQGGHISETGWTCGSGPDGANGNELPGAPSQGDHELQGDTDVKHIESTNNSDDDGKFRFRMHSPVTGATQVTTFVDEDGDDQYCVSEANANASISWGTGTMAPAPSGVPSEETFCPVPGQSPSPSTTSPAPSTTSPDPSTTSPSPTGTVGPGVSASTTRFTRFNYTRKGFNKFFGRIDSAHEPCDRRRTINIKKLRKGRDPHIVSTRTDQAGRFRALKKRASGRYYAVARARTITKPDGSQVDCLKARSRNIRVRRR